MDFSIINKCTVYTLTEGSGIKYIMFYDKWGGYLSNGNQSGWQRDNNVRYMTFITTTQKNIITNLEIYYRYILYIMSTIPIQTLIIDNDTAVGLTSDLINGTYKTFSLTDLSNNVYTRIADLSSNIYTQLNNKQPI
jgi:hypothetical protein